MNNPWQQVYNLIGRTPKEEELQIVEEEQLQVVEVQETQPDDPPPMSDADIDHILYHTIRW